MNKVRNSKETLLWISRVTYLGEQAGPKTCSVPVSVLRAAPFSLPWGSPVYATVIANNIYGASLESLPGSGGRIITYPDPPI